MKISLFAATAAIAIVLASLPVPAIAHAEATTAAPPAPKAIPDPALAALAAQVDIPYEQFTLSNGLRVLVHTDRKALVVGISVWYDVGSKQEPKGKTGFAHLFEHLMFNGSENADDDFFKPMQQVGATSMNGTTSYDRTNYYETVPTGALDLALYLESDRMGHLLGAVTQQNLDEQRGAVQNEFRQRMLNAPYGTVSFHQTAALFPPDHPYGHLTIGSMADLDAASLDDVRGWFREHYGPNNAVIALAGDIDLATAKRLMTKYFGDIPASPKTKPVAAPVPIYASEVLEKTGRDDLLDLDAAAQVVGGSFQGPLQVLSNFFLKLPLATRQLPKL